MIVSWNWLTQYVRLTMPVDALTQRLALTGLNHESTTEVGGDFAIDLEVTSNRSDCLGHLGVAREISVLFETPLLIPDPRPKTSGAHVATLAGVTVETSDLCPRFTARVVTGAAIRESPWWLRKRLETLGVRPVSNVVDVTNYVMFECGQPLHAYGLDTLAENRLVVRLAKKSEKLTAINGKVYELTPEMLVIADAAHPVGLAGVMGGLETEIRSSTRNILIEAAQFDAMSVRKTARALGLFSPSSYRFERSLDPEITEWASRRCAELILETAGGTLHPGFLDVATARPGRPSVTLRLDQIPRVLGIEVDRAAVERILQALGLKSRGETTSSLTYDPPSWRNDLEREIDLIEEVARIHGYEHIPENRAVPLTSAPRGDRERVESIAREALTACGFDEACTFSLVADTLSVPVRPGPALPSIRVDHSSRRREGSLRQSLLPSLLTVRRHNEAHGNAGAEVFEIADVYLPRADDELPDQPVKLGIVSGKDFLGLKGVVEALVERLHAGNLEAGVASVPWFQAGRTAELLLGGEHLGYVGEVDRSRLDALELRADSSAAELDLGVLMRRAKLVPQNRDLPPFPAVIRDLSLLVDRGLPWSELSDAVKAVAGSSLESVDFLDTFHGGNIPEGKHSVHFGLKFRHPERTLTGEEVDRSVRSVIANCATRFEAVIRG